MKEKHRNIFEIYASIFKRLRERFSLRRKKKGVKEVKIQSESPLESNSVHEHQIIEQDYDSININSDIVEINIKYSDSEKTSLLISEDFPFDLFDYEMKVKSRKLNIFIKQKRDRPNLNLVLKLEVYLPIKVYKQLTVHSISGDVYVNTNNITFLNIDLESVNGNIDFFSESEVLERTIKELNNIKVSTESGDIIIFNRVKYGGNNYFYIDSKINTISGDIKLNLDSASMDILTTSGDVNYTDSVTTDLKIISCSGDINSNIITVSDTKAFLQTVSGDINFDATDISNCIYNGRLIEKGGHNSLFLQCKTVSGEINYK